jgi:hypothetical protein
MNLPELTKGEEQVLFHTLGLDYGDTCFRNSFLAGDGHHDQVHIEGLLRKGLFETGKVANGGTYYYATLQASFMAKELKASREPKLTRSQARYRQYLKCDSSMAFFEWITHPYGANAYGL